MARSAVMVFIMALAPLTRYILLSLVVAPVAFLSYYLSLCHLSSSAPPAWCGGLAVCADEGWWQKKGWRLHLGSLAFLKLQQVLLWRVLFELRARRLGCLPAAVYPHGEFLLGVGWFRESSRALSEGRLLDVFVERFLAVGHTHWNLALGRWMLMTDEPDNIKSILATGFEHWPIAGPRLWAVLPQLGRRSVFTTNGAAWHEARSTIRPSFVRDQVADLRCFATHVGNLVRQLCEACDGGSAVFDLQELLMRMTMDSSTDFMLGCSTESLLRASPEAMEFLEAFDYVSFEGARRARLGPVMHLSPSKRFDEGVKKIRSFVRFYVAKAMAKARSERAAAGEEKKREGGEGGRRSYVFLDELVDSGADEEYILDQVLSIIIAGRDTTAGAMTAMFYFLARSPEVVRKVVAEIEELGEENPSWEQLRGMKYLQNVVREALRLFPPVATNSRSSNKEVILPRGGGPDGKAPMLVPAGTSCRWSSYSTHRRKDIYGPDANEFRPERWEELRVGWEYTPFSGGPRICIGQQFALTQISYTLFRVLKHFKTIESRDPSPMRIRVSTTVTLANGCLVSMTPV